MARPLKRIVIIEDQRELTTLLKMDLETEGYEVFVAHDGKSGITTVQQHNPNLIILDVMMPEMNGYEVLRKLKENPMTKDTPVIILSAKGLKEEVREGKELGAYDYVAKPFNPELFLSKIRNILTSP